MVTQLFPRPPAVITTLAVGAAVTVSTVPSLLPRSAPVQGLLTGALVLTALALVGLGRALVGRLRRGHGEWLGRARESADPGVRWLVLAGTVCTTAGAAWLTQHFLTGWTAALGMPRPTTAYWLVAGLWAGLLIALMVILVVAARRIVGAQWRGTARPLAVVVLAGATVTTAAAAPVDLLGAIRKDLSPGHVMLVDSPLGALRSFALVDEAPTPRAGAELAVERMAAAGGLERAAIVVALPTGSGWVNGAAVAGMEAELGGDVAVVSAQYSDLPSWWHFLLDREPAHESAHALLREVVERVGQLPVDERPDVYVYGESLGAMAGQSALADLDPEAVCGVVWSGSPAAGLAGHPRERSLANPDDPVVRWTPATLWEHPQEWPTLWLPGVSYLSTTLDLAGSLRPDPGHGHQYGAEQDWALPRC